MRRDPEALVLACILSVAGLMTLTAWLASGAVYQDLPTGALRMSGAWLFSVAVVVVLMLDLLALAAVVQRLFRSDRAPSARWAFGAGLLAMIAAMAGAALTMRGHIGKDITELYLGGVKPEVSSAVALLACGVFGLLLATLALLFARERDSIRSAASGDAALVMLCTAGFCLSALSFVWWSEASRLSGYIPTGEFALSPVLFAGLLAVAAPLVLLALLRGRGIPARKRGGAVRLSIATFLLLALIALALWTASSHLLTAGSWVPYTWWAILALVLLAGVRWLAVLRGRESPARLSAISAWVGTVAASLALLAVASSLETIVENVFHWRRSVTPRDFIVALQPGAP